MTKRIVSGIFILTALGALGVILAGALTSGEQLIVRFLTAVVVAALGLYVISDLRLQADDDAVAARNRRLSGRQPASVETAPNSTAAFMATVTTRKQEEAAAHAQAEPVEQRPTPRPLRAGRHAVSSSGQPPAPGRPASTGDQTADPELIRTRTMAVASAPETTVLDEEKLRRAVAGATNGGPADRPASDRPTAEPAVAAAPAGPTTTAQTPTGPAATNGVPAHPAAANGTVSNGNGNEVHPNGTAANGTVSNGNGNGVHPNGSGRNGVSLISGGRRLQTPLGTFADAGGPGSRSNGETSNGETANGSNGSNGQSEATPTNGDATQPEAPKVDAPVAKTTPILPVEEPFEAPLEAITTARIPNLEELAALGPRPFGGGNSSGEDVGTTTVVIPMADLSGADDQGQDDTEADETVDDTPQVDHLALTTQAAEAQAPATGPVDLVEQIVAADEAPAADAPDQVAVGDATVGADPVGADDAADGSQAVAEHDWPMPDRATVTEVIDVTTTDEPAAPAPVALAPTSRPPARRLPITSATGADAVDYTDAPLAPIIDLREVHTLNAHGNIDNAIKAGELEVISTLIEQGMLSTDGPISDRDVRTMVYVAFTSNELRKLLLAGGSPDRPNHGLDLGPVELFDERHHAPIPKTIYTGNPGPRPIEAGQESARSQLG